MPGNRNFDFTDLDRRSLTPQQREILVQRIMREARAERAKEIRTALRAALAWLGKLTLAAGHAFTRLGRAYADRRRCARQMAELEALGDRELKDMGVRRSEIYWVVHHGREVPAAHAPETCGRIIRPGPPAATTARRPGTKRSGQDTPVAA
jgi:uncharacterized protein YjiS (DUF1127 family)